MSRYNPFSRFPGGAYPAQYIHPDEHRRLEEENKRLRLQLQQANGFIQENKNLRFIQENKNLRFIQENKNLRSQLEQAENKFKNYQERMGKMTDLVMGSGEKLSEDLTNPCRESELKLKYDELRNTIWPAVVYKLKKQKKDDQHVKENAKLEIKRAFEKAEEDTKLVVKHMQSLAQLKEEDVTNKTKTLQCFDLAIQNLQKALYHKNMQLQNMGNSDDLNGLVKDFYNIRCLLALHNPPICLDWENCGKEEDFPPIKHEEKTDRMVFHLGEKQEDLREMVQNILVQNSLLDKRLTALEDKDQLRAHPEKGVEPRSSDSQQNLLTGILSELQQQVNTLQKDKEMGDKKNMEELKRAMEQTRKWVEQTVTKFVANRDQPQEKMSKTK